MTRGKDIPYRIVGIIDEQGERVGRNIRGVPILGDLESISDIFLQLCDRGVGPQRMLITNPKIDGQLVGKITEMSERIGVPVSRIPKLTELDKMNHDGFHFTIKPIEMEDVLGRPQTILDISPVKNMIKGRKILITGAGGTIGCELTRQVANLDPAEIMVFDNCEFLIYQTDLILSETFPDINRQVVLGDVRDKLKVNNLISQFSPDIIIHSAALKHVPLVENNPIEGIHTNVIGTWNIADAAINSGVKTMVLISTDKAVDPSNVMGATKRLAETICQSLDATSKETRFVVVRFGNVLGSTGSVIPLFERQIAAGGPLTVTHPEMTRYFMTVKEAVSLVLQAAALTNSSKLDETGGINVLEMGKPVRDYRFGSTAN